jgi:hypothetical protein
VLFKTHYQKYMEVSQRYEEMMSRMEGYEDELEHAKVGMS